MKKSLLVFLAVLAFSAALFAQYDEKKMEFSIMGGYGLASLEGTSSFSYSFGSIFTDDINESTALALLNKNTFALGANFSYFFTPNIGVQFGGGFFAPKADTSAVYVFDWSSTFFGDSDHVTGEWDVADGAKLTSIPLYLNLIGKYSTGSFSIYGTAGPTLFINKFQADSFSVLAAYGLWGILLDYFQIPLMVPETSWTAFGFNAGAGFEVNISPSVGFLVEARYFYAPKKDFTWTWVTGTYDGIDYWADGGGTFFKDITFTDLSYFEGLTSGLTVNPSYFTFMGGFKFYF